MPKSDYLKSILSFHSQFKQSHKEASNLNIIDDYSDSADIIIAGMGGSSFGGRVLKAAFSEDALTIPVSILSDYNLPNYADEKTLVIVTSYSGNTEEAISILHQSKSKGCKIVAITSGGKLKNAIESGGIPGYIFDTKDNPSGSPRTGIGYIIGSTLGIMSSLKFIDYNMASAEKTAKFIQSFSSLLAKPNSLSNRIAQNLDGKIPVFISAEHLTCASYISRNFLNETAKMVGFTLEIPDMNHHSLDGLLFPSYLKFQLKFVYFISSLYGEQIVKRFEITSEITKRQGFEDITIKLGAKNKLDEIFEVIIIGSLMSYNLAISKSVDPSTNEMVDFLKSKL